jgi:membrane protease YdiL (CAAX protease family)
MLTTENYFYNYSLLHAMNSDRLNLEKEKYQTLSRRDAAILGASVALYRIPAGLFFHLITSLIATNLLKITILQRPLSLSSKNIACITIFVPTCEELFFRGCLQNYLSERPETNFGTRAILISHLMFTLVHLPSGGALQTFQVAIGPQESILYHTTKKIEAPLTSHIVHNLSILSLAYAIVNLKKPQYLALMPPLYYGLGRMGLNYINSLEHQQ